jgi:hypothetical protein
MKSLKLLYPFQDVIPLLLRFLKIKGFEVTLMAEPEGIINAVKKRKLKKDTLALFKVSRRDDNVTVIEVSVYLEPLLKNKPLIEAKEEEKAFFESMNTYF